MFRSDTLHHWMPTLLPEAGRCAQDAGATLVRSLLVGYTTDLTHLARQVPQATTVKSRRQRFARWLSRPHWAAQTVYTGFFRTAVKLLPTQGDVLLVVDFTDLEPQWRVLQVSFPWEQRALPLYRVVLARKGPHQRRREVLRAMLRFLREHLPGPLSRYVLVMDRGFPGHWLVRELQEAGFRFVMRLTRRWKVTHREFTGPLAAAQELAGAKPRLLRQAQFGRRGKGRNEWSVAHLVLYHGEGQQEPWYLITSEEQAAAAVAIYRERPRIEGEFRDLKGLHGIDRLAGWKDRERVARFLALVAVYEWRLAALWVRHRIGQWARFFVKYGRLGWMQLTHAWLRHRQLLAFQRALARL